MVCQWMVGLHKRLLVIDVTDKIYQVRRDRLAGREFLRSKRDALPFLFMERVQRELGKKSFSALSQL